MNILKGKIEKIISGGMGLCFSNRKAVFIPYTAIGDELTYIVKKEKKTYCEAEILDLIQNSPDRIEAPCPYYGKCGGCNLQHINTEAYLNYISSSLEENLLKIAHLKNINIEKPKSGSLLFHYRKKASLKLNFTKNKLQIGFYERKTKNIVDITQCLLMSEKINSSISKLKASLKNLDSPDYAINLDILDLNKLCSIFYLDKKNNTLINSIKSLTFFDKIIIYIKKKKIFESNKQLLLEYQGENLSSESFFQVNPEINQMIKDIILKELKDEKNILDIYCGYGNLSLPLALNGSNITGIEENSLSIKYLINNTNYQIINQRAKRALHLLAKQDAHFNAAIIDPPRAGASDILKDLIKLKINKLIYLSCNSSTLMRDISILKTHYKIKLIQPFVMFPQTEHYEILVLLEFL